MKDYNHDITDKEIRDLLKWRLLEQVEDDDQLTRQLMDMEAMLVFGKEAQTMPSPQKENELVLRLKNTDSKNTFLKVLLPLTIIALAITLLLCYIFTKKSPATSLQPAVAAPLPPDEQPVKSAAAPFVEDTVPSGEEQQTEQQITALKSDTLRQTAAAKWTSGDAGIKVEYAPPPYKPKFVDSELSVPSLSGPEMEANNKLKEKMIKELIRKDKSAWCRVPMGSDVFYGDTVSMRGFYIAATEVTNKQYHVFLNDLLINGRTEDYLKAVPDTSKWLIRGSTFFEPMRNMYFWHPAYADYPVLNVSREGANMYCVWLTIAANDRIKKDKPDAILLDYMNDLRIPQEEEWMMAARGGTIGNGNFPWSTTPEKKYMRNSKGAYLCNFMIVNDSTKGGNSYDHDGALFTAPVNSYFPNTYGIYNMAGNAAEMVRQYKTNKPAAKGGSWNSDEEHVKIDAAAEFVNITEGSPYVGFRPVFTAQKKYITIKKP